jgi:putative addiction module antidote
LFECSVVLAKVAYYNNHWYTDMKLKLRSVGTSTGVILPKELLCRLKVKKDDHLFVVETHSGFLLTPYDPEIAEQVRIGREFVANYRDTFRALAE